MIGEKKREMWWLLTAYYTEQYSMKTHIIKSIKGKKRDKWWLFTAKLWARGSVAHM